MGSISYASGSATHDQDDCPNLICLGCENILPATHGYCPECSMPAEISNVVQKRQVEPSFVSILGASNAGKTVYLGLLADILTNSTGEIRGAANGPFSISLQEHVIAALEKRTFPEKTPLESDHWQWLHCEVSLQTGKKDKQIDFIAPDVAGEAISFELEQAGSYRAILNMVSRSSGILILCDSTEVRDSGSQEDLYALKLASYISELHPEANPKRGVHAPAVGVLLTKTDQCGEAADDPESFTKYNMPRFYDFCAKHFPNRKFFASGMVGAVAVIRENESTARQIPLHVQPTGILEPLEWIVRQ